MELDKLKWEKDRLLEDIDLYKAQVQEQKHLTSIVEGNLEESIKSLSHDVSEKCSVFYCFVNFLVTNCSRFAQ